MTINHTVHASPQGPAEVSVKERMERRTLCGPSHPHLTLTPRFKLPGPSATGTHKPIDWTRLNPRQPHNQFPHDGAERSSRKMWNQAKSSTAVDSAEVSIVGTHCDSPLFFRQQSCAISAVQITVYEADLCSLSHEHTHTHKCRMDGHQAVRSG